MNQVLVYKTHMDSGVEVLDPNNHQDLERKRDDNDGKKQSVGKMNWIKFISKWLWNVPGHGKIYSLTKKKQRKFGDKKNYSKKNSRFDNRFDFDKKNSSRKKKLASLNSSPNEPRKKRRRSFKEVRLK